MWSGEGDIDDPTSIRRVYVAVEAQARTSHAN
jgi:hypothetical protein